MMNFIYVFSAEVKYCVLRLYYENKLDIVKDTTFLLFHSSIALKQTIL